MAERTCRECGDTFETRRRQWLCSAECRHTRWTRRHDAMFNQAERRLIFERDGWRCGICGEQVDPSLALPDLMSAAVDHIVPFAQGGRHDMSNAQCSHWICNARKYMGQASVDIARGA